MTEPISSIDDPKYKDNPIARMWIAVFSQPGIVRAVTSGQTVEVQFNKGEIIAATESGTARDKSGKPIDLKQPGQ